MSSEEKNDDDYEKQSADDSFVRFVIWDVTVFINLQKNLVF